MKGDNAIKETGYGTIDEKIDFRDRRKKSLLEAPAFSLDKR